MSQSFHVTTFGCQMNEHDSERMKGMLESLGYREVPERGDADLILFNTCSIREKADDRFVAHLHEAKALKRRDPERVIGVGGCWAQSVKEQVFRQFPFVDVAFGPGQVHKLAEFLTSDSLTAQGYFEFEGFTGHLPPKRAREVQALDADLRRLQLPLLVLHRAVDARARGLPAARRAGRRGRGARRRRRQRDHAARPERQLLRPRPAARAGDRSRELLTARRRGRRRSAGSATRARTRRTCARTSSARTPSSPSVCEHIHLPLQAGTSRILKAMRRTYTRERYMDRVALIREHVPDVALTTDIIVGFPGETEAEFRETLEVVEEVGYDGAFTFIFSPRRGTEAAELDDPVAHEEKVERMQRLVEVVQRRARERAQRFVGRTDGGAGRGPVAHRPEPPARPHAPQQGRELRRPRARRATTSTSRSTRRRARRCWASRSSLLVRRRLTAHFVPSARVCEHVFVRWERTDSRGGRADAAAGPSARTAVVRRFDAPEALDTRFYEVRAKSALNRVPQRSRVPFSWTVNPYRGCSHGCVYCFARPTHEYLDFDAGRDFEREIVVKVNVPEVLRGRARAAVVEARARRAGDEHRPVPVGRGALQADARDLGGDARRRATRARC